MISLRDNFNPVKREERREGGGREGGRETERKEKITKLCLLKNVKLLKF